MIALGMNKLWRASRLSGCTIRIDIGSEVNIEQLGWIGEWPNKRWSFWSSRSPPKLILPQYLQSLSMVGFISLPYPHTDLCEKKAAYLKVPPCMLKKVLHDGKNYIAIKVLVVPVMHTLLRLTRLHLFYASISTFLTLIALRKRKRVSGLTIL